MSESLKLIPSTRVQPGGRFSPSSGPFYKPVEPSFVYSFCRNPESLSLHPASASVQYFHVPDPGSQSVIVSHALTLAIYTSQNNHKNLLNLPLLLSQISSSAPVLLSTYARNF